MSIFAGPNVLYNSNLKMYFDSTNTDSYPGSGTTIFDLSGNGNNGTLVGSPTVSNGILNFNGSTQYVTTNYVPNITTGTVFVFFRQNILKDYNTIFDNNLSDNDWELWIYLSNTMSFRTNNNSSDLRTDTSGFLANIYYCVTLTWSATDAKVYRNGILVSTDTTVGTRVTPQQLNVAGGRSGNTKFDGSIPLFAVYDRELTEQEIKRNFNALRGRYSI